MVRRLVLCLSLIISCTCAHAVEGILSHSVFYLPDPANASRLKPSAELCWQMKPSSLHFITNEEKHLFARIKTDIVLSNSDGIIAEDHFITATVPRASVEELETHSIIELRRYKIKPGFIRLYFVLTDVQDTSIKYIYRDSFTVAEPTTDKPFYSELQLLDTMLQVNAPSPFLKNGRQQVPLSSNFLDNDKRQLHYYAEIYGAAGIPTAELPLLQRTYIAKRATDAPTRSYSRVDTLLPQKTIPVSGSFDIGTLVSGNYYLVTQLENRRHDILASTTYFFQRLNTTPDIIPDSVQNASPLNDTALENVNVLNLNKTFLQKYSLAEIRAILKMLLPVSDYAGIKTINNFLKNPDEMYMRYYIYNFFQNINKKDPAKAWKEYTEKVKYVNKRFTAHGLAGYETDRGFLYLRYGAPSDIITVENEQGTLPYEIWQYDIITEMSRKQVANAFFLFYKKSDMGGDYTTLHSNVTGEVQNLSWRSFLYKTNKGYNAANDIGNRAEQYIGNK